MLGCISKLKTNIWENNYSSLSELSILLWQRTSIWVHVRLYTLSYNLLSRNINVKITKPHPGLDIMKLSELIAKITISHNWIRIHSQWMITQRPSSIIKISIWETLTKKQSKIMRLRSVFNRNSQNWILLISW